MISPALITSTEQPISSPRPSMIAILCRVALLTVAPFILIGSRIATGDTFPDLPTCHITSSSFVTTPAGLVFFANAPRGW